MIEIKLAVVCDLCGASEDVPNRNSEHHSGSFLSGGATEKIKGEKHTYYASHRKNKAFCDDCLRDILAEVRDSPAPEEG